jgi:purine-binding chemotaxis protein CheW
MRPLPIEELKDMPGFVRGVSIIRGSPFPVVDPGSLLGMNEQRPITRFITLRISDTRGIALAVDEVLGIRELDPSLLQQLPSLLQSPSSETIEAISPLDDELLIVLRASKILSEDTWQALGIGEGLR